MELDFPKETLDHTTKVNALHFYGLCLFFPLSLSFFLFVIFAKFSYNFLVKNSCHHPIPIQSHLKRRL